MGTGSPLAEIPNTSTELEKFRKQTYLELKSVATAEVGTELEKFRMHTYLESVATAEVGTMEKIRMEL